MADGKQIYFWQDRWLGETKLIDVALKPIEGNERDALVIDYWRETTLDWEALEGKLPYMNMLQLAAKRVHCNTFLKDCVRWGLNTKGEFSVKSSYWIQFEDGTTLQSAHMGNNKPWKQLWKTKVTKRQKLLG